MNTAIIYASQHGTTAKVAQRLAELMGNEPVRLFNLKQHKRIDLAPFDRVILGGSIHAGQVQGRVKDFCKNHMVELMSKPLGLFICGMNEPEYEKELASAFPELLRNHARSTKVVGGEFLFEKMNFIEKAIVRKIVGINQSVSKINDKAIQELANVMDN